MAGEADKAVITVIKEINYYSGADSNGNLAITRYLPLTIPYPPSIPGLLNGALVSIAISHRLEYLQSQIQLAVASYEAQNILAYRYALEGVITSMKRVMDDLVMTAYCVMWSKEVTTSKKLEVDGYGALFKRGKPTAVGERILAEILKPTDNFAVIFTELANSFKHSYMLPEAQNAWGMDFPTVLSIYAHRNDYSGNVHYHNHSLGQIIIGFNKFVQSGIENIRVYQENQASRKEPTE